jgi:hypothetical protein
MRCGEFAGTSRRRECAGMMRLAEFAVAGMECES